MLKKKLIQNLTKKGKAVKGEKIFLQLIKEFQKNSKFNSYLMCQLAFSYLLPVFKIKKIKKKTRRKKIIREVPAFIKHFNSRLSMSIKTVIINTVKKKKKFHKKMYEELLQTLNKKSSSLDFKITNQKIVSKKKFLVKYFK